MPLAHPAARSSGIAALAFASALLATACAPSAEGPLAADVVLFNGTVLTVDAEDRIATAVAIKDHRILAVGADTEILRLAGPETERIDLQGRTATPGLLDAHAHFLSGAADRLFNLDLSYPEVKSIEDVKALVAGRVAAAQPGEWITGRGWDEGKLEELRYILAADLDSVAPQNPVWLVHTMGHYGAANSAAMRLANLIRATPDPVGGTIDRAPDGTPTGVLKESAQRLVGGLVPGYSTEQVRAGIRDLARAFNAECMTGAKDPGVNPDGWSAYQDVLAQDSLSVRIFALWRVGRTVEAAQEVIGRIAPFTKPYVSTGDDRLVSGGVKLYIDGSGGARTAWMYDDWNRGRDSVDAGNRGYPATEPDVLREQIRLFNDAGIHVSVHAIGDQGIDWVVDSYAAALEANPVRGLRHGIIHANIPTDHALDVMARLQKDFDAGFPEPSATFMWWIGDTYAGNFGPERSQRLDPFRTFLSKGIRWAGGSDYGVTPFPARYGIWASVARETERGVYGPTPFGTAESVGVRDALRSYTAWGAHQFFMEDRIGSLEPGKYADIAVWDRNPYEVPTGELRDMKCEMTLFDGDVVYRAPTAP
ncbi:MAG: amidohydrolase family protein [Longimicrobiales bacterium]|nr:amidohydrolase family protein [Longimicrobiales bacterium]